MSRADMQNLVIEALRDPRGSAQRIIAFPAPSNSVYEALVLVGVVSTLALFAVARLAGVPILAGTALPPPVFLAVLQVGVMLLLAGALRVLGRLFGGTGSFDGSLRVIVWLQALMFLFQLVQLVAMLVIPPVAGILSMLTLGVVAWIATGLIAGLHGFRSLWLTLAGTIAGLVAVALLISLLLGLFLSSVPV